MRKRILPITYVNRAFPSVTLNLEIIATEGTARAILESGIIVTKVSDSTGFQEMLGGKVKTLPLS